MCLERVGLNAAEAQVRWTRLVAVLEEAEDKMVTVQVSSGMFSKQTEVLPNGGPGAAGFSKFLFTPLFGSRRRSTAFSSSILHFLFAPSSGSLLFDEPLDLGPQGLQILLLKRVKTCCLA